MRNSAFAGTWRSNRRPYLVLSPDCYVSIQGETSVIGCGECKRRLNFNDYVTGISTEASIDSAPGSATINLSIPDTDINDFYSDGELLVGPMMEIEIYARGYYTIGGAPQYYRIFWGLVSTITKSWADGVTTVNISCKDILRWWELTYVTRNPAFVNGMFTPSSGNFHMFGDQFAGMSTYAVIIYLARNAMGDILHTTNSFNSEGGQPERGAESGTIGSYMKDIMAYWQLRFSNISANLVLYGASGDLYTVPGSSSTVSPTQIAEEIFKEELRKSKSNQSTNVLLTSPKDIVAAKQSYPRAVDINFFQSEQQSKLSMAFQARDQAGYEFYCDPSGDIVFKPPFFNLNVLPNKPVSWIQDFEILDDSYTDSEAEVVTQVTTSGNAFGGVQEYGVNDEFTTPRAGAFDYHLLRRYGWRRQDLQLEWAGTPRKMFYHVLDYMDRLNAKRKTCTITIPMRPELRLGFPIWVPKYDSFFYIQGISHSYNVGGQATTVLTLTAKRSKFIAPQNVGEIVRTGNTRSVPKQAQDSRSKTTTKDASYNISFPNELGATVGQSNSEQNGKPAIIRDPKTGKLLGCPNIVMVFRKSYDGKVLAKLASQQGSARAKNQNTGTKQKGAQPGNWDDVKEQEIKKIGADQRDQLVAQLRAHRYEAGLTNGGFYDYAIDRGKDFKELQLIPADSIAFGTGTSPINDVSSPKELVVNNDQDKTKRESQKTAIAREEKSLIDLQKKSAKIQKEIDSLKKQLTDSLSLKNRTRGIASGSLFTDSEASVNSNILSLIDNKTFIDQLVSDQQSKVSALKTTQSNTQSFASLLVMIRPVSDEFGFEVIGHYRYGRGSFIDAGGLKIQLNPQNPSSTVNQLNIPFAVSGGSLTDNSSPSSNLTSVSQNFARVFETMTPDDYVTGASFARTASKGNIEDIAATNKTTYTDDIQKNKSTAVFVEADSLRKAKTLEELSPTIESDVSKTLSTSCSCGLAKANWYSLLPADVLAKVLAPSGIRLIQSGGSNVLVSGEPDTIVGAPPGVNEAGQVVRSDGTTFMVDKTGNDFFTALKVFLSDKFRTEYEANNKLREEKITGGPAVKYFDPFTGTEPTNVLPDPKSPLFNRASLGDPDALRALQNDVNFSFGLSKTSVENFKKTVEQVPESVETARKQLDSPVQVLEGTTEIKKQPLKNPTLQDLINPSRFNSAAGDQFSPRPPNT